MAKNIPVKSDSPISRKMNIKEGRVRLIGYTVKVNRDDATCLQYDEIVLVYPGAESTPAWVLERAAKADWITIQTWLRKQSGKDREAFEGVEVDCSDMDTALGKERTKRDSLKTRLSRLANGELTTEDFMASLTSDEKSLMAVMMSN